VWAAALGLHRVGRGICPKVRATGPSGAASNTRAPVTFGIDADGRGGGCGHREGKGPMFLLRRICRGKSGKVKVAIVIAVISAEILVRMLMTHVR
jgi:hypothetical protein